MSISRCGSFSNGGNGRVPRKSSKTKKIAVVYVYQQTTTAFFLQGETAKSEGILTSLKQFIGIDLSVKSDEFSGMTILQTDLVPRKALA